MKPEAPRTVIQWTLTTYYDSTATCSRCRIRCRLKKRLVDLWGSKVSSKWFAALIKQWSIIISMNKWIKEWMNVSPHQHCKWSDHQPCWSGSRVVDQDPGEQFSQLHPSHRHLLSRQIQICLSCTVDHPCSQRHSLQAGMLLILPTSYPY